MNTKLRQYNKLKKQFGPKGTFKVSYKKQFKSLVTIGDDTAFAVFQPDKYEGNGKQSIHLNWAFIDEEKRNTYAAGKLAKQCIEYAKENGFTAITGSIRTSNIPSQITAIKLGAIIIGLIVYADNEPGYRVRLNLKS